MESGIFGVYYHGIGNTIKLIHSSMLQLINNIITINYYS
jgi:hypothetical protein